MCLYTAYMLPTYHIIHTHHPQHTFHTTADGEGVMKIEGATGSLLEAHEPYLVSAIWLCFEMDWMDVYVSGSTRIAYA